MTSPGFNFVTPQTDAAPAPAAATTSTDEVHDLIIVGSGPSGYTAALYAARAELNVPVGTSICEALLDNGIEIEHACDMSCACTTCHCIVRKGFDSLNEVEECEEETGLAVVGLGLLDHRDDTLGVVLEVVGHHGCCSS